MPSVRPSIVALVLAVVLQVPTAPTDAGERVELPGGEFKPVIVPGPTERSIHVAPFLLDRHPVTNREFLAFVRAKPEWRRDRIAALYADEHYLSRWSGPDDLGPDARAGQPVTDVSWYAARAYCGAAGGRLPRWYEWEYSAAADEKVADARQDPAWRARILGWYSRSAGRPPADVGASPLNAYGVGDLHGLVWEWVEDYAGLMVSGDSRTQGDPDKLTFCGAGALSAEIRDDYPVLMRIALLSSLEARYTTSSLGFRCADDVMP